MQSVNYLAEDRGEWLLAHSLEARGLALGDILKDCRLSSSTGGTSMTPVACFDMDKLAHKVSQLRAAVTDYENRIQWLSTGSRLHFGELIRSGRDRITSSNLGHNQRQGQRESQRQKKAPERLEQAGTKAVFLLDSSDSAQRDKQLWMEVVAATKLLVKEQLSEWEVVRLVSFGSSVLPNSCELEFTSDKENCFVATAEWLSILEPAGCCDLLAAVKFGLSNEGIDTLCLVLSSSPNQRYDVILDYIIDRLVGSAGPRLHVVALNCGDPEAAFLSELTSGVKGHYHRFTSSSASDEDQAGLHEDSDLTQVRNELELANKVLQDIAEVESGNTTNQEVLAALQETLQPVKFPRDLDMTCFSSMSPSITTAMEHYICEACSSEEWLKRNGVAAHKLDLYQFLAPNAFAQLESYVDVTQGTVFSQVYDIMPLFPWNDGSQKYLYVNVREMEKYQKQLQAYKDKVLQCRKDWLHSGSRAAFGTLTERRVVLLLTATPPSATPTKERGHMTSFWYHIKTLLEEQVPKLAGFNIVSTDGSKAVSWAKTMAEPHRLSVGEAWRWLLDRSCRGVSSVSGILRYVFESGKFFEEEDSAEQLGVYLIVDSAAKQQYLETACDYIVQAKAGRKVNIHAIFYDHGKDGEKLDVEEMKDKKEERGEEEVEQVEKGEERRKTIEDLNHLATVGGGRFFHYQVSGSTEGDDVSAIARELFKVDNYLKSSHDILDNYREFCKRNVPALPPPPPEVVRARQPITLPPRPTTTSQERMSARLQWLRERCKSEREEKCQRVKPGRGSPTRSIKSQPFYLNSGIRKGLHCSLVETNPSSQDSSHGNVQTGLPPSKQEMASSRTWLAKYGVQRLGLDFNLFVPPLAAKMAADCRLNRHCRSSTYSHSTSKGESVELFVSREGLKAYVRKLTPLLRRYQDRLQWLCSDPYRFIGVVTERKVVFLSDVSMTMSAHSRELSSALSDVLRHTPSQLRSFNVVACSTGVSTWQEELRTVSEENISAAVQWLEGVKPAEMTCLLEAIRVSLCMTVDAVYLITNGEMVKTGEFLLQELPYLRQTYGKRWKINGVAFHCSTEESHSFLKALSAGTGGRYHCHPSPNPDTTLQQTKNLSTDVKQLFAEITLANSYLAQAKSFL